MGYYENKMRDQRTKGSSSDPVSFLYCICIVLFFVAMGTSFFLCEEDVERDR